ncbi:tRNA pseudouridine(55) synthase TruB [Muribacter muris]|uniref:tRNA pseudouridine synthase B n=1 Tax=Muribacter muris TaxID=67855 RepID=A0A4Y9K5F7_9PAST|nr:tRNA pseudouridine(55) synthase TruB [Muribacter muris]MBF0784610.1 tRNA pseudouridine(55) synthase TruB [Muribacter muris]MBF0828190.1 tRNA pseudouridine(55) synthase TruB [Muribacter muris]TFV11885.1 tRNA pseudouridine(55) synthase TruB [Muribacter muris]
MGRPRKKGRDIHGVFLLDKPQGVSSNEIMQKVKRLFQANKAGHTGALDPLATGMLPICLGEATKFSQFLLDADKRYRVTAKLGERTDTSDAEGQVVQTRPVNIALADILAALPQFRGDILQVPTMFSALKHNGKPLYEYARAGITIEREARPITIFELIFIDYQAPFLTLDVHCSKGTYIRTLVDDLGEALGCGAHVTVLRRLAVADYPIEQMMTIEALQNLSENQPLAVLDRHLLAIDSAVARLPKLLLTEAQGRAISFGQRVKFDNQDGLFGQVRLFSAADVFLGVAEIRQDNVIRPSRLVNYGQAVGSADNITQ